MKRMALGPRIATVGGLILVIVSVALFYFIAKGFSKDIAFATQELRGNQYQRALESLLDGVSQHLILTRELPANPGLQPQLAQLRTRVDASFDALAQVQAKVGEDLQFTPEGLAKRNRQHTTVETLRSEWLALKSAPPAGALSAHTHLIADLRTMITHSGDTSNLILDPDLDSYYLMDVTLLALPQNQDRLLSIATLLDDALAAGPASEQDRTRIAVAAALLKEADLDRINADLQTTYNEDSNFYGPSPSLRSNLATPARDYTREVENLLTLMSAVAANAPLQPSRAQLAQAASSARRASYALWNAGVAELDVLLQRRIDSLAADRLRALILTFLALAASATFAVRVIRSTTSVLQSQILELTGQSGSLASAAGRLAIASHNLTGGACQQAAFLERTSTSSDQISRMARKNAGDSQSASTLAAQSQQQFDEANRALAEMVAAIADITAQSGKIANIIKTIDGIAFQTNILALNAAVEAARASQAGSGFAVVADEVRNLAQRSARAAADTAALIQESIALSHQGKDKVSLVADSIHAITGQSQAIRALVDGVSAGSDRQARGVDDVAVAVSQMKQVTTETAAAAEECAASVAELNHQSAQLNDIVAALSLVIGAARR